VNLSDLRGPALVDLWATWCVPCARSLPFYQQLAARTGIRIVAISIDSDDAPVRKWLLEHATSLQILRDPNGVVAAQLGMQVMPTSFLIDSRGVVRARHEGFREEDEPAIEADVRALLARDLP
jgi:thiol-disulfide isomerase/thioredoxin